MESELRQYRKQQATYTYSLVHHAQTLQVAFLYPCALPS